MASTSLPLDVLAMIAQFNEFAAGVPASKEVVMGLLSHLRKQSVKSSQGESDSIPFADDYFRFHRSWLLRLQVEPPDAHVDDDDFFTRLDLSNQVLKCEICHLDEGRSSAEVKRYLAIEFPATEEGFHECIQSLKLQMPDLIARGPCPGDHSRHIDGTQRRYQSPHLRMRLLGSTWCAECSLRACFSKVLADAPLAPASSMR